LTDPGAMALWTGAMAFRRARWVQETFACRKFPAEITETPQTIGGGQYTAPWSFYSVPDRTTGRVDFRDTSSVVCANCHASMNHLAPLFASFDDAGRWQPTIQVRTPVLGLPFTEMRDWLIPGEQTAWRHGRPAPDLPALGRAMAEDRDTARCAVARVWNWALSKTDIVEDRAEVPEVILEPLVDDLVASGHRLRRTVRAVFASDDFVRF
jgi:hypothetical protein